MERESWTGSGVWYFYLEDTISSKLRSRISRDRLRLTDKPPSQKTSRSKQQAQASLQAWKLENLKKIEEAIVVLSFWLCEGILSLSSLGWFSVVLLVWVFECALSCLVFTCVVSSCAVLSSCVVSSCLTFQRHVCLIFVRNIGTLLSCLVTI